MAQNHYLGKEAAAVYERLREEILTSRLVSGSLLQQVDLAKRLEVSRTPIRHALHQLAADGLVEFLPGQIARVVAPTMRDALEMRQIRLWLEVPALLLALRNQPQANQLIDMFDEVEALGDEPTSEASARLVTLDENFHRWILEESGNRQLKIIGDRLLDLLFRGEPFNVAQDYQAIRGNLLALRDAIQAHDLRQVRQLMIDHMIDTSGMTIDPVVFGDAYPD